MILMLLDADFEKELIAAISKVFPMSFRGYANFLGNFLIKTIAMQNRLMQISLLGLYLHFRVKNPSHLPNQSPSKNGSDFLAAF